MKQLLFCILLLVALRGGAQHTTVWGRVVSAASGQPLRGATVSVQDGFATTFTDSSGAFSLAAGTSGTLLITFNGFNPATQTFGGMHPSAGLFISLQPIAASLQEVTISTGYQKLPAGRSTGSFVLVDSILLGRSVTTNLLDRLEGLAPSLLFDRRFGTPRLSVRGRSTIFAAAEPLVVVDNFPYEGDINTINPADVENITILRDAAAASIWGVRAANGVIVITTKRGRFGAPLRVSLTANSTVVTRPDLFAQPAISPSGFIEMESFLFEKGFYRTQERSAARPVLSPAVEVMIRQRDGLLTAEGAQNELDAMRKHDVRNDFKRSVYRPGLNLQYALNLTGGSSWGSQALSVGYDNNRDVLNASYRRFTARYNNSWRIGSQVELFTGIAYTGSVTTSGRKGLGSVTSGGTKSLYPYAALSDELGHPLPVARDYRTSFVQGAEASGLLPWQYYPLADDEYIQNTGRLSDLVLQSGATVRLFKGLTAEARFQHQSQQSERRNLQGQEAYATRDLINRFTSVGPGGTLSRAVPMGDILDISGGRMVTQSLRAGLTFSGRVGQAGSFDAIGGAEYRQVTYGSNSYRTYGYNNEILTHSPVNYDSLYAQYHFPSLTTTIPYMAGFSGLLDRFVSYYANASYTLKERYMFSLSGRRDGSNIFGVATNQKFVPLWSVGAAWQIDKESFFSGGMLLKLRASWGYNGNIDNSLSAYTTLGLYPGGGNLFINEPYAILTRMPDPDLRWERVGIANLGFDIAIAGGRLNASIDAYRKQATDLVGDAPVDPTTGIPTAQLRRNIGRMVTHGADLSVQSANLLGAFRWNTALLFSYNRDRLTRYDILPVNANAYASGGTALVPVVGKPVYNVFSFRWAGLDHETGDPLGFVEGKPSRDYAAILNRTPVSDLVYHGPALPPFFGSLRNTFSWRNLELSANITWRMGHYFRRPSVHYGNLFNQWRNGAGFDDRWQKPGDEKSTNVPSMVYPANTRRDNFYNNASVLVERAGTIRLQDVRLAFNLQRQRFPSLPFRQFQVYAYATDLGLLWRANGYGIDPDYGSSLPLPPAFSFGIKADL